MLYIIIQIIDHMVLVLRLIELVATGSPKRPPPGASTTALKRVPLKEPF